MFFICLFLLILVIVFFIKGIGFFNRDRDARRAEQMRIHMSQFQDEADYQLRDCKLINQKTFTRALNTNYNNICNYIKANYDDSCDIKKLVNGFFKGYHVQWGFMDADLVRQQCRTIAEGR